MSFTLVKTPPAYGLPTAQPSCLEALLYLTYVNKSPHGITTESTTSSLIVMHDNKYWCNKMDIQHTKMTTLPILHHKHAIVPTNTIIPYLKDNLCNIDDYLPLSESVTLDAFRTYTNRLVTAVQFVLAQESSYPVAEDVFWGVRWLVRADYLNAVTAQAAAENIFTVEEATMEISYMLANLTLKLGDANYFGPQGKLCSVDFTVCAAVSFCVFAEIRFLTQLLYQYYPTLVRHCQTVLTTVLEGDHQLEVLTERLTAQIRKDALSALLGTVDQSAEAAQSTGGNLTVVTKQTPEKKKKKKKSRRSTYHDDYNLGDGDADGDGDGDADYNSLDADTELFDEHVVIDDDDVNETSLNSSGLKSVRSSLISRSTSSLNSEQAVNATLQPSSEQIYNNRHLFPTGSTQQVRAYAVQAFLLTTQWVRIQIPPPGSWTQQFILFGSAAMILYFVIAKAKKDSDAAFDTAKAEADCEDFHRIRTPLIDNYTSHPYTTQHP